MARAENLISLFNESAFPNFKSEFKALISLFNRLDIEYCIAGSVALSEYTSPRATSDIDVYILDDLGDTAEELKSELEDKGFDIAAVRGGSQFAVKCFKNGKLKNYDLILTVGMAPEGWMINTAISKTIFGVPNVKVATKEALVCMLLSAMGDVDEKSKSWAKWNSDLVNLVHSNYKTINFDKVFLELESVNRDKGNRKASEILKEIIKSSKSAVKEERTRLKNLLMRNKTSLEKAVSTYKESGVLYGTERFKKLVIQESKR